MKQHMRRAFPVGWVCWACTFSRARGWRHVGAIASGVVDDFGNFVMKG